MYCFLSFSPDSISIHALREEGDAKFKLIKKLSKIISIHALREEGDYHMRGMAADIRAFLSTPSARRATKRQASTDTALLHFYPRPPRGGRPNGKQAQIPRYYISIHALREEGDFAT